jgi:hypothetical protein
VKGPLGTKSEGAFLFLFLLLFSGSGPPSIAPRLFQKVIFAPESITRELTSFHHQYEVISETLDNASDLAGHGHMPQLADHQKKLSALREKLQKVGSVADEAKANLGNVWGDAFLHPSKVVISRDTVVALSGIDSQFNDLSSDAFELSEEVIDAAKKEREQLEISYRRYSHLGDVLYVIGWSLGLIGSLFGQELDTDSSEAPR